MKKGLIRIEKDIFYDTIEKVYRYRRYCYNCGTKIDNCICYDDLETLHMDINDESLSYVCSSKCVLSFGDWDELTDVMEELGYDSVDELTEDEASVVVEKLEIMYDYSNGSSCSM